MSDYCADKLEAEFHEALYQAEKEEQKKENADLEAKRKKPTHDRRVPKVYLCKGELLSVKEIAKRANLNPDTVRGRLNSGWKAKEVLAGKREASTTINGRRPFGENVPIKHNFF